MNVVRRRSPSITAALVFPVIVIAAMVYAGFFNWTHRTRVDNQVVVRGQLREWSEIHIRKGGRTPRFTIVGNSSDFRIDPALYRDLMKGEAPVEMVPGAPVEIRAEAAQVASPLHPPWDPSASIIWVNGLAVDGRQVFSVADVIKHGRHDALFFIPLIGVPLAYAAGLIFLWQRRKTQTLPTS